MTLRPDLSPHTFLVVEDFEGMRGILRDMLTRAGASRIAFAQDAAAALRMLERQNYDVVLCDLHLGRGRNGQELLEEARQRRVLPPHTVWLMVSAEKTAEMVAGTVEARPDDYLIKPLTETLLYTRLTRQMARKRVMAPIELALRAGEPLKAQRLIDAALEHSGTHAWELKRLRAELALQSGDDALARAIYQEALARRDVPWAHLGLARIDFRLGDYAGARARLEQVTSGSRAYLEAHDWLARVLDRQGELAGAQEILRQALSISPRAPHRLTHLGEVAFRRGELDAAANALRRAIELARGTPAQDSARYLTLVRVQLAHGDRDAAMATLTQLTRDHSDQTDVRLVARAMEIPLRMRAEETTVAWALAQELAPELRAKAAVLPTELAFDLAGPLLELGDTETAAALMGAVVGNHHEHPEYPARVEALYAHAGRADEGRALVARTAREAIEIMDRGVRLFHAGKLDEAVATTRAALARMPDNARLLLNHAFLLIAGMERHGYDGAHALEARTCIERAHRLKPEDKRAGELLARMEVIGHDFVA